MTKTLLQADKGQPGIALHIVDKAGVEAWLKQQSSHARAILDAQGFKGEPNQVSIIAGDKEKWSAAIGVSDAAALTPWCLARAAELLPEGSYRLANGEAGAALIGWILGQYVFDRYKEKAPTKGPRTLLSAEVARIEEAQQLAEATAMVRDLVNIPASDLGPAELEQATEAVAKAHGAKLHVTRGNELANGFPMIHAVGMAAAKERAPRLIELEWGNAKHPRIAIIGKGVCFDSGGLDIKPASGMLLMKKDMGGAAHALALARLVMQAKLPVHLHLLIPAVENSVSAAAFRPGDVLASRKGVSVEIGNTDAEGRLILGDALTKASEGEPELILDFATLTGAARVALGPDLPALFANDDALAADLLDAGASEHDPVWRMPLWQPYHDMLKSTVGDLNNAAEGGFAGAVTAALFLQRFVPDTIAWAHFDTFAWRPNAKPGRPKGGDALGLRSAFAMLKRRYAGQSGR